MKLMVIFVLLMLSGCIVASKGPQFVDPMSGKPHATLIKDPQPKPMALFIDTIDGKRARIDQLFRDELYAGEKTYVSVGVHTVFVHCSVGGPSGKYVEADITFMFQDGQ